MGQISGAGTTECRSGDGRAAQATCDVCGEAVCDACLRDTEGGRAVCAACAYGDALSALEARREAGPAEAEIVPDAPVRRRPVWPLLAVAVALVEVVVLVTARANTLRPERVAPSPGAQVRRATVECVARLQALATGAPARRICPLSGRPLQAQPDGGAECPDAPRHGLPTLEVDRDGRLR